jgi:hypothetical protein
LQGRRKGPPLVPGISFGGYCAVSGKFKSAPPTASGVRVTRHPVSGAAGERAVSARELVESRAAKKKIPNLYNECDPNLRLSRSLGSAARDVALAAAIPNIGLWAQNPFVTVFVVLGDSLAMWAGRAERVSVEELRPLPGRILMVIRFLAGT